MSSKKKILIIQPIHADGIKLLEENSDYEFEIVENTEKEFLNVQNNVRFDNYKLDTLFAKELDIDFAKE